MPFGYISIIQYFFRNFSLDQNGGLMDQQADISVPKTTLLTWLKLEKRKLPEKIQSIGVRKDMSVWSL